MVAVLGRSQPRFSLGVILTKGLESTRVRYGLRSSPSSTACLISLSLEVSSWNRSGNASGLTSSFTRRAPVYTATFTRLVLVFCRPSVSRRSSKAFRSRSRRIDRAKTRTGLTMVKRSSESLPYWTIGVAQVSIGDYQDRPGGKSPPSKCHT